MRPMFKAVLGFGALALAGGNLAHAGFTPINPPPIGEDTHQAIFNEVYGGDFVPSGLNFTNGNITAIRVEDYADEGPNPLMPMNVVTAFGLDDQLWLAGYQFASAEAKFAAFGQNFGYFEGTDSTTYVKLFDQTGYAFDVGGEADLTALSGKLLRWARGGEDRVVSSRMSDNADGQDHMVTYFIQEGGSPNGEILTGATLPETVKWLIFFEDKFEGEYKYDFDFNDLVVEITATRITGNIPEPTSLAGLMGGALLGLRCRRSRRIA